jgi:cell division septation protein DedD
MASAGSYTYYFLADEGPGSWTAFPIQLTVMYFPTAYGTVDEVRRWGTEGAAGSPLTSADITAEQAEAREFNLARVESELAEIRAEVEAMKAEAGTSTPAPAEPASSRPVDQQKAAAEGPTLTAN